MAKRVKRNPCSTIFLSASTVHFFSTILCSEKCQEHLFGSLITTLVADFLIRDTPVYSSLLRVASSHTYI